MPLATGEKIAGSRRRCRRSTPDPAPNTTPAEMIPASGHANPSVRTLWNATFGSCRLHVDEAAAEAERHADRELGEDRGPALERARIAFHQDGRRDRPRQRRADEEPRDERVRQRRRGARTARPPSTPRCPSGTRRRPGACPAASPQGRPRRGLCSRDSKSTCRLPSYTPSNGAPRTRNLRAPGRTRTCGLVIRSDLLCPTELRRRAPKISCVRACALR